MQALGASLPWQGGPSQCLVHGMMQHWLLCESSACKGSIAATAARHQTKHSAMQKLVVHTGMLSASALVTVALYQQVHI